MQVVYINTLTKIEKTDPLFLQEKKKKKQQTQTH